MSVFSSDFTFATGSSYAIFMDSFEQQIGDLAHLLSASGASSGSDSAEFIAGYINRARKAVAGLQPMPNGTEQHEESSSFTPSPEARETAAKEKQALLLDIAASVQQSRLSSLSSTDAEKFANLFVPLLVSVQAPKEAFDQSIAVFSQLLSTPSSLQTLLSILPIDNSQCSPSSKLALARRYLEVVPSSEHRARMVAQVPALVAAAEGTTTEADLLSIVDVLLKREDEDLALVLLESVQSLPGSTLPRRWARLTLAKPTCFTFPNASVLDNTPEKSLVDYVASKSDSIDSGLLEAEQPVLTEEGLKLKRTALAIAKLFSTRVGQKVQYSEILPLLSASSAGEDQDVLIESAIIDAIKSKLVQARLSQPAQSISVISSKHISLPLASTLSEKGQEEAEREKWLLIQQKLNKLRSQLANVQSGINGAIGSAGLQQQQGETNGLAIDNGEEAKDRAVEA